MKKRYLHSLCFRLFYTLLFGLICGLTTFTASAQDYVWAGQYVNRVPTNIFLPVHTVDPAGNSYVAGNFTGIVDVDLSPTGVRSLTAADANGDLFLAKYEPTGKLVWVYQFSGNIRATAIAFSNNKFYVAGNLSGSVNVNPAGTATMRDAANGAAFFARYTTAGQLEMVKQLSASGEITINQFAFNDPDYFYLTGSFNGSAMNANPDPDVVYSLTNTGEGDDLFLVKYSTAGAYQWALNVGSPEDDGSSRIGVDNSGNIYWAGKLADPALFNTTLVF